MKSVLYRFENAVGYISLNRPEKANTMTLEVKTELTEILRKVRGDNSVRTLIITGNGKYFCAGGDVSTMGGSQSVVEGRERMKYAAEWVKELANIEKSTIAVVNGPAVGAGLSLALACDFIIASQTASFACSFIKVGLVADTGILYHLPRRVGLSKAKRLIFTGETISGLEAERIGLVDTTVPQEELMKRAIEFAEMIAKGPTYAIGMNKTILNKSYETDLNMLLELEATSQAVAFQTSDHKVAAQAFQEKHQPTFKGE